MLRGTAGTDVNPLPLLYILPDILIIPLCLSFSATSHPPLLHLHNPIPKRIIVRCRTCRICFYCFYFLQIVTHPAESLGQSDNSLRFIGGKVGLLNLLFTKLLHLSKFNF